MDCDRRYLLAGAGATLLAPCAAMAGPLSTFGLDAAAFGVRPGSPDDQSRALQRAIEQAAKTRIPLMLAPGVYRASNLKLPSGTILAGVRGATRLVLTQGPSLVAADHAEYVSLTGLILDGGGQPLPSRRGLVHMDATHRLRIADCDILNPGGIGIALTGSDGEVMQSTIAQAADTALFSRDGHDLHIAGNTIRDSGNGGIRVWQSEPRHDGSSIVDNTVENTGARAGGSGQNGNAINVFRAGNVIVRGNHIRKAAFSAIRGNAASNIQIVANNCSALDEVAIYAEFGFQGAVIADNIVDGAADGVSVTNFNEGGRFATVHGNVIRNLAARRPGAPQDEEGIGISVEADTAVTGNVIENARNIGIAAGWGRYLRNVAITGNVIRQAGYGIAVSVSPGAGDAVISGNLIQGSRRGAIVGMERHIVVTRDLSKEGADRYRQLKIDGNQIR